MPQEQAHAEPYAEYLIIDPELAAEAAEIKENRARFMARFKELPEEKQKEIEWAYDLSKESHRPQVRASGERYFEHPRNVALILADECGIKEPNLIIAGLLHDSVEDSPTFGNRTLPRSQWVPTAEYRLTKAFNPEVARMVIGVTKPSVDGAEITTKEQAHHVYMEGLEAAEAETMLIKMADRLHNLRTLGAKKPAKQAETVKETKEVYFPLFKKHVDGERGATVSHLLELMEHELEKLASKADDDETPATM